MDFSGGVIVVTHDGLGQDLHRHFVFEGYGNVGHYADRIQNEKLKEIQNLEKKKEEP